MGQKAAAPEEIWSALESLRGGEKISTVAKLLSRNPTTVKNWGNKYGAVLSLDALKQMRAPDDTRYIQLMTELFRRKWVASSTGFEWDRDELPEIAESIGIKVPKNLGDNIYSIRHGREELPEAVRALAPSGTAWLLLPNGKGKYRFTLTARAFLDIDRSIQPVKIPDSTPQIVSHYAKDDEQAVLARIRYCRLIDIFMGVATYQLQSHMRTTIKHFNGSQTELDEIYVGVDGKGEQFIIPIQAKSAHERIGVIQIITDHYACIEKFPNLTVRKVATKIVKVEEQAGFGKIYTIALIEAEITAEFDVSIKREQHYQLVSASSI